MITIPKLTIDEVTQDEFLEFQKIHFSDELNSFLYEKFLGSLIRLKGFIVNKPTDISKYGELFDKYFDLVSEVFKSALRRKNFDNSFLKLFSFCKENKEIAEEIAKLVNDNIEPFKQTLKEG